MNIKKIIKDITPPILMSLYRRLRDGNDKEYIWEGVYKNYSEVPTSGSGYKDGRLLSEISACTKSVIREAKGDKAAMTIVKDENAFLPFLASIICRTQRKIRVLDFGGGMGISYVHLVKGSYGCTEIDYHVIELREMCEEGTRIFEKDEHIYFHRSFPENIPGVDIVYINSALQYIEDYKNALLKLSSYNPKYFLFVRFSAGNIPTFATKQKNLTGTTISYWFFNLNEIIELMNDYGYQLIFKGILGREYNLDNFPEEYRLPYQSVVLFSKQKVFRENLK